MGYRAARLVLHVAVKRAAASSPEVLAEGKITKNMGSRQDTDIVTWWVRSLSTLSSVRVFLHFVNIAFCQRDGMLRGHARISGPSLADWKSPFLNIVFVSIHVCLPPTKGTYGHLLYLSES